MFQLQSYMDYKMTIGLKLTRVSLVFILLFVALLWPQLILAATLSVSPATGVYTTGSTFTVTVVVNTDGKAINAADGTLSFNPRELTVVSVSRSSSIFSLWTSEPAFSNSAGTVTFSGGSPSGFTGGGGSVVSVTFRSLTSGAARVAIAGGSVLAADGRGTNILTNMNGGTYTLSAVPAQPLAEVIVEYVPPANTPIAPKVISLTHPDTTKWYAVSTAELSWSLPSGVTAVRTSLDTNAISIPTKVYDSPLTSISLKNLDEGISYFHIQLKNKDGWGKIAHYRLAIDTKKPEDLIITLADNVDLSSPVQSLVLKTKAGVSPVENFKISIDGSEPVAYVSTTSLVTLPEVKPGSHMVVVEAIDGAGNSVVGTFTFEITSFDKPIFTEYPSDLSAGVIPVIKGMTKPLARVVVTITLPDGSTEDITAPADENGVFTAIAEKKFTTGVYTMYAIATDARGAKSLQSDSIKIVVSQPGYVIIGTFLVNLLSVIIPLFALCVLAWLTVWYSIHRVRTLRVRVLRESDEVSAMITAEFEHVRTVLHQHQAELIGSRKTGKLTVAEEDLIHEVEKALLTAQARVSKEASDVTKLVSQ